MGQTVSEHPRLTAVVASEWQCTYEQLWEDVEQWRRRCAALGLPPGSIACIIADADPQLPAAFLGARAAGAVPMLIDGRLAAARIPAAIDVAQPAAVIRLGDDEVVTTPGTDPRILPDGASCVVFSSGSQGVSKGIVAQARGQLHFIDWEIERLGAQPGWRTAMLTSPSFEVIIRDLLLPLCTGGEVRIAPSAVRISPRSVLPWLAENDIDVVHVVPSMSARWIGAAGDVKAGALRWTLFAGEPLYEQQVTNWRSVAPRSRVLNLYGPAETTLAKLCYEVPPTPRTGLQPVGRPLSGTQLELERASSDGAADGPWRIVISTPHGSLGYLAGTGVDGVQQLRRTDGMTRFVTQDRGHWDDDGNLVVTGRLDSLVKRNGVFVDLARIESAALALPDVRATCCFQLLPSGHVVLAVEGPTESAAAQLRRRLQPRLGIELPDRVVAMPTLPLLPGGKVDRRSVRALLAEAGSA
ncbi:MAG: AMP-binding protein [Frankiaceae bacterium]